jgi:hypothetical protein
LQAWLFQVYDYLMRQFIALIAVILTVGFASGADAHALVSSSEQRIEAVWVSSTQSIAETSDEAGHADHKSEKECCWDGLCANAAHCHHAGVTAFTFAADQIFAGPDIARSFDALSDRLPRLSVHYSIIDPPRA